VIRVGVRVRPGDAEAVLAQLLEAFPAGVDEREVDGAVEFGVYGSVEALPTLDGVLDVVVESVPDGWETAYHAYVPRVVAGRFAVRPPWVAGLPSDLVIDPRTAFGAGTHPTTRLCLELLTAGIEEEGPIGPPTTSAQLTANIAANCELADWGTGTGVLAIAAARVGYRPVLAIDVDPASLDACRSNARANSVGVATERLDIACEAAPHSPTVIANLTLPLLQAAAKIQPRPQRLIASGVLTHEADAVAHAFGMVERERRELDGWAAMVLT
jgi:ribosomal protein L11 methyltransferase